jgi:uncharacterized Ntn-hydrolase superfamily protein
MGHLGQTERTSHRRVIRNERRVATFSIVGFDPATGDLGVAVASKFLAVGAVVPFAKAGVGAVATQSWANTTYGPVGLELLAAGNTPQAALDALTGADDHAEQRQAGIVDAQGRAATYTGASCPTWAGGIAGPNFAAQGNILVGEATIQALAQTFPRASGSLAHRLLESLAAGQRAGGDSRGQQSAALLVVRDQGGYGGFNDRMLDLRVDDHARPIDELTRLLEIHQLLFLKPRAEDMMPIDGALATELQQLLARSGDYSGAPTGVYDQATFQALERYGGRENLEERLAHEPTDARIDRQVLKYMREHIT